VPEEKTAKKKGLRSEVELYMVACGEAWGKVSRGANAEKGDAF